MQTLSTALATFRSLERGTKARCYLTAALAAAWWTLMLLILLGVIA